MATNAANALIEETKQAQVPAVAGIDKAVGDQGEKTEETLSPEEEAKRAFAPFKCTLCDEDIGNMKLADDHINGKPHRRKMELHFIEKCVKKEKCELCGTQFTSLTQVFDHLGGFEHASNTVASRKPKMFGAPGGFGRGAFGAAGRGGAMGGRGRGFQNGGAGRGAPRGGRGGGDSSRGRGRGGASRGSRGGRGGGKMQSFNATQNRLTPYIGGGGFGQRGRGGSRGRGRSSFFQNGQQSMLSQAMGSGGYDTSFMEDSYGDSYGSQGGYGNYGGGSFGGDSWYSGMGDGYGDMSMNSAFGSIGPPPMPPF